MGARRIRILVGSTFSAAVAISLFVTPVAAACALNAPATVDIGSPLKIEGSGFPAGTSVDVSLTIEGGSPDEFTVQSSESGAIEITFTPDAADTGVTTVIAAAGSTCTAQAVIGVGVEAVSATPAPAPTDDGTGAAAPRTDGLEPMGASSDSSRPWLLAGLIFVLGLSGLWVTRPQRKPSV